MTTTVIGDNIIGDTNKLDDFSETHKIKLYRKAAAKGRQYQKELDKIFTKEKEKAEDLLEDKISEILNSLAETTKCHIARTSFEVTQELSRKNPREKEYKVGVTLTIG